MRRRAGNGRELVISVAYRFERATKGASGDELVATTQHKSTPRRATSQPNASNQTATTQLTHLQHPQSQPARSPASNPYESYRTWYASNLAQAEPERNHVNPTTSHTSPKPQTHLLRNLPHQMQRNTAMLVSPDEPKQVLAEDLYVLPDEHARVGCGETNNWGRTSNTMQICDPCGPRCLKWSKSAMTCALPA